jgi:hypothetical protein
MLASMRTTLTLDDDVVAQLERLRRQKHVSLKELINELLRQGLAAKSEPQPKRRRYRTQPVDGGRCLIGSLDCISEALAIAEGEGHK